MSLIGRSKVFNLIRSVESACCSCPSHSAGVVRKVGTEDPGTDYAFEMACSNIRYGPGVTSEVGQDFEALKAKQVLVFTDPTVAGLPVMKLVTDSLQKANINFSVFDKVRVEPTNESLALAIAHARAAPYDAYLAVGGGSVMDTAKAANLFASDKEAELLDYVNAPIGKGKPVMVKLNPLIAVPTTSGTGSETTGVSIFDHLPLNAKTGIADRSLRPTLGIVDPLNTITMPERVAAYSGFDVLCHALESFTAIPYNQRSPRPSHPRLRPAYQGSNPISDVWARTSLQSIAKHFKRSVYNADDMEARSEMHLASAFAGVGFGNAGVHLCHGMSYAISGNNKKYHAQDYSADLPLIPHGLSVVITAPAVFNFTAPACPERHLEAASLLGADVTGVARADAGLLLSDVLRQYMSDMKVEDGLTQLGYSEQDLPALVEGTLPQHRVTKLAPLTQSYEDLHGILEKSMKVY